MGLGIRFWLIVRGLGLGIGAAAPIGPVNVEIARRTLRGRAAAGFALGCGAVTVDVTYAVLSSLSLGRLLNRPAVVWPITIGGVLLLIYLGVLCLRGAVRDWNADPLTSAPPSPSVHGAYLTGVLMTLLNPMTIAFWFVMVPATVGAITSQPGRDLPWICVGVFFSTLAWVMGFVSILSWAGRWRRNWWLAAADAVGGVLLLAFAAAGLWRLTRPFL